MAAWLDQSLNATRVVCSRRRGAQASDVLLLISEQGEVGLTASSVNGKDRLFSLGAAR